MPESLVRTLVNFYCLGKVKYPGQYLPCGFFFHPCHTFANHPLTKGSPNDPNFKAPSASCCHPAPTADHGPVWVVPGRRVPPGFTTSQPSDPGLVTAPCLSVYVNTLQGRTSSPHGSLWSILKKRIGASLGRRPKLGQNPKLKQKQWQLIMLEKQKSAKRKRKIITVLCLTQIVYSVYTHSNLTVNTDLFKVLKWLYWEDGAGCQAVCMVESHTKAIDATLVISGTDWAHSNHCHEHPTHLNRPAPSSHIRYKYPP